ncbi:MAG: hypothetical protein QNI86_13335 [Halieaceae bacterium]|nr:hypothetical protein [Halieaceae bacterium]
MKRTWPSLFAAALLAANAAANSEPPVLPEPDPDIVGEALDPDTGNTVYLEHYYCSEDLLKCSVFYLRPNREVIASKELDYASNLKAPALTFRDYRLDREITIEDADTNAVVDAGFDNFVRLQWQDLAEGEEIKFPFRLVDRKDPIKMRASKTEGCEDGKLCLEIELDSWLLGNFVDPIQLTYEEGSQRLLRFQGISNLKNDEGRSQTVEIRYRYLDGTEAPTSLQE